MAVSFLSLHKLPTAFIQNQWNVFHATAHLPLKELEDQSLQTGLRDKNVVSGT
jgi:hypothetical protein